jgi:hypothetical protein
MRPQLISGHGEEFRLSGGASEGGRFPTPGKKLGRDPRRLTSQEIATHRIAPKDLLEQLEAARERTGASA